MNSHEHLSQSVATEELFKKNEKGVSRKTFKRLTCGGGVGAVIEEALMFLLKSDPRGRGSGGDNKSNHLFASVGP